MPSSLTYPGVYIEELPSGVRTVVGVATSITAFIGRAQRGPVNEPIVINSYSDFERRFGGLWIKSSLGYAVRDFYLNGGSQAIIVRLFRDTAQTQARAAAASVLSAAVAEAAKSTATATTVATAAHSAVTAASAAGSAAESAAKAVDAAADGASKVTSPVPKAQDVVKAAADAVDQAVKSAVASVGSVQTQARAAAASVLNAAEAEAAKPTATAATVAAEAHKAVAAASTAGAAAQSAAKAVDAAADTASKVTSPVPKAQDVAKAAADAAEQATKAAAAEAPSNKAELEVKGPGDPNSFSLVAAYDGAWGNNLRARVDVDVSADQAGKAFNLTVRDTEAGVTETFRNLALAGPRQIDNVLTNESRLVRVSVAPTALPKPHADPQPGQDIWKLDTLSSGSTIQADDGVWLAQEDFDGPGKDANKEGLYALRDADLFNLLCIPPYLETSDINQELLTSARKFCNERRAMLLVDPPANWQDKDAAKAGISSFSDPYNLNAALFFPRLKQPDPLRDGQLGDFAPCGAVAGIFARTDATRGVWKAPAGLDAALGGVPQLSVPLTDMEVGELNPLGINCLRTMPAAGRVVWGSRTLAGDDRLTSDWKYIPVRRTALFIEESLYRSTQWIVFEPNDEPLWSQIRLNIGAFMHDLFRKGAFQGTTPKDAYFVKCDKETTTQSDINLGIVNIVVGFAPLKPAEFVVIKLQQMAGQIDV